MRFNVLVLLAMLVIPLPVASPTASNATPSAPPPRHLQGTDFQVCLLTANSGTEIIKLSVKLENFVPTDSVSKIATKKLIATAENLVSAVLAYNDA